MNGEAMTGEKGEANEDGKSTEAQALATDVEQRKAQPKHKNAKSKC